MRHQRNPRYPRPYRARDGMIFGVCLGLARHFDFNVRGVRVLAVVGTFMTGIWPAVIAYIVAALVMRLEPMMPLETDEDAEFYNSYSMSRTMALQRLKRTYDHLDRRIQRIEGIVTARDYDWDNRLREDA